MKLMNEFVNFLTEHEVSDPKGGWKEAFPCDYLLTL